MLLGGRLAGVPVLAVAAIAALGIGTALLAARSRVGQMAMVLSLPMAGVGLSYDDDAGEAAALAALMVAGSALACLISMAWPELPRSGPEPGPEQARRRSATASASALQG